MKKSAAIFLFFYYSIGTLLLPLGDFSMISNLPEMYHNCKTTEHADMTIADFVTDHLLNIDSIFDHHNNGDDQKPHQPLQEDYNTQTVVFANDILSYSPTFFHLGHIKQAMPPGDTLPSGYYTNIFHPPIVSLI